jgi:AcrR family transcriptional regulator
MDESFETYRPYLLTLAFHLLGSASVKDEIMFTLLEDFIGRIDAHLNQAVRSAQTLQEDVSNFLAALTALLEADPHVPLLLIQFVAASLNRSEIAEQLHTLFASFRQRKLEEWVLARGASEREHDYAVVLVNMLHTVVLGVLLARPFLGIDLPSAHLMQGRTDLACLFPILGNSFPGNTELNASWHFLHVRSRKKDDLSP